MGYRSRERKRRHKIAVAKTRREHAELIARRWFLTIAKRTSRCTGCGRLLRPEGEIVYRHEGRLTMCVPCADADPLVEYRPSVRWERWRQGR